MLFQFYIKHRAIDSIFNDLGAINDMPIAHKFGTPIG